jgi:hypothetical protein
MGREALRALVGNPVIWLNDQANPAPFHSVADWTMASSAEPPGLPAAFPSPIPSPQPFASPVLSSDEPTGDLDAKSAEEIRSHFRILSEP